MPNGDRASAVFAPHGNLQRHPEHRQGQHNSIPCDTASIQTVVFKDFDGEKAQSQARGVPVPVPVPVADELVGEENARLMSDPTDPSRRAPSSWEWDRCAEVVAGRPGHPANCQGPGGGLGATVPFLVIRLSGRHVEEVGPATGDAARTNGRDERGSVIVNHLGVIVGMIVALVVVFAVAQWVGALPGYGQPRLTPVGSAQWNHSAAGPAAVAVRYLVAQETIIRGDDGTAIRLRCRPYDSDRLDALLASFYWFPTSPTVVTATVRSVDRDRGGLPNLAEGALPGDSSLAASAAQYDIVLNETIRAGVPPVPGWLQLPYERRSEWWVRVEKDTTGTWRVTARENTLGNWRPVGPPQPSVLGALTKGIGGVS
jgi:hypothetical protein